MEVKTEFLDVLDKIEKFSNDFDIQIAEKLFSKLLFYLLSESIFIREKMTSEDIKNWNLFRIILMMSKYNVILDFEDFHKSNTQLFDNLKSLFKDEYKIYLAAFIREMKKLFDEDIEKLNMKNIIKELIVQ